MLSIRTAGTNLRLWHLVIGVLFSDLYCRTSSTDVGVFPVGSIAVLKKTFTALETKAASVNSVYSGVHSISISSILYWSKRTVNSDEFGKSFREKLKVPIFGAIPFVTMSKRPSTVR